MRERDRIVRIIDGQPLFGRSPTPTDDVIACFVWGNAGSLFAGCAPTAETWRESDVKIAGTSASEHLAAGEELLAWLQTQYPETKMAMRSDVELDRLPRARRLRRRPSRGW